MADGSRKEDDYNNLEQRLKNKAHKNLKIMTTQELKELRLPLSKMSFKDLQIALQSEQIIWKDLANELKEAYNEFRKPQREKDWEDLKRRRRRTG